MVRHSVDSLARRVQALESVVSKKLDEQTNILSGKLDRFIKTTRPASHIDNVSIAPNSCTEALPLSTAVSSTPRLQRTGRLHVPTSCSGCSDYRCVNSWQRYTDVPTEEDAIEWFRNHDFFRPPECETHKRENMQLMTDGQSKYKCMVRENGIPCRMRVSEYEPICSIYSRATHGTPISMTVSMSTTLCV